MCIHAILYRTLGHASCSSDEYIYLSRTSFTASFNTLSVFIPSKNTHPPTHVLWGRHKGPTRADHGCRLFLRLPTVNTSFEKQLLSSNVLHHSNTRGIDLMRRVSRAPESAGTTRWSAVSDNKT